jgi:hypothetical protein
MWEIEGFIKYKYKKADPLLSEIDVTGKIIAELLSTFLRKLLLSS